MTKRDHRTRRRTHAKPRRHPQKPAEQCQPPSDHETVDGILVQIKKTDLTIAGEPLGQVEHRPGYQVSVAIPEWAKNRGLLDSVRKGYLAQQKLLSKLQGEGVSRQWMIQRFNEVDKTVAASLTTVAEIIRTRRWREKERGAVLQLLQDAFHNLQRWTAKTTRYCELAEQCPDPVEIETILDAACLGVLKVGELINKVERMQHGFWEDFSAAHFLDIRNKRNLIGHTDDLEGKDVIPLGTGVVQDLQNAIRRTLFPENSGTGGFVMSSREFYKLEPARPGEKPAPENSIAMILIDEHNRFVIHRAGRTEDNKILISSSVTGRMNLSIHTFRSDSRIEPGRSDS